MSGALSLELTESESASGTNISNESFTEGPLIIYLLGCDDYVLVILFSFKQRRKDCDIWVSKDSPAMCHSSRISKCPATKMHLRQIPGSV